MPLEDILKKIGESSSAESRKILTEAEERSRQIVLTAREEASSRKQKILGSARGEAAKVEALSRARADAYRRQLLLKEKQALVDSVMTEVLERLADMPAPEYKDLVLRAIASIAEGNETLTLGPEDKDRLGPGFAEAANAALESAGKQGQIVVTYASSSLGGGLTLSSGGVSHNMTFPAVLEMLRDDMEMEIARTLFSS